MALLIDADVLIRLERSARNLQPLMKSHGEEQVYLSVVTASELLHGVWRARDIAVRARRQDFVEAILDRIPILEIDVSVARRHASLWAELAEKRAMIGLHDSWIAATCLVHQLTLLTYNAREFDRVQGLTYRIPG